MKILAFGEILWDVFPEKAFLGGASLNFAAHMARHGRHTAMLSAVGRDELGREALAMLDRWGISQAYVSQLEGEQTGKCIVTLDENSIPSYDLLGDVAYDRIDCGQVREDFDVLYFGTLSLRGPENRAGLEELLECRHFGEVFADVNIRPPFSTAETVRLCADRATTLKISLEELPTVARWLGLPEQGDHAELARMLARGRDNLRCVLITLGGDGAYALDCVTGREYSCPGVPVEVCSTVGAGDSFSAAFLHRRLEGQDMQTCLEYAAKVAAFVVSRTEAVPEYRADCFV